MNIQKMMKQMQQMQSRMAQTQEQLAAQSVEASVGGGRVVVTATGAQEITKIKISKDVVSPDDVEMLEDMILSAIRACFEKAVEHRAAKTAEITAGLPDIPGMPKF